MRLKIAMACALALALVVAVLAPATAGAWAPAGQATVHPGVHDLHRRRPVHLELRLHGRVERLPRPGRPLLGHRRPDRHRRLHSGSLPIGTPVEVDGASKPGTLVYNSWLTMQAKGETDPDTCAYNDLALVKIDPADVGNVNPSVPGFGGPTGGRRRADGATRSTRTATRRCARASRS